MEFSAHVADPIHQRPLDVHVDVFQFRAEQELALLDFLADFAQGLLNLSALVGGDQSDFGQHLGVGDRAFDIMRIEPAIEAHAFGELLHAAVGRLVKHAPPRFVGHYSCSRLPRKPPGSLPYSCQQRQQGCKPLLGWFRYA